MSAENKERSGREVLESIERKLSIPQSQIPRKRESEDLKEFYKALHSAQKKFKDVYKSGSIAYQQGRPAIPYAKINDLIDASRSALSEFDLVCHTYSYIYPDGLLTTITRLVHFPSGQYTESELPVLINTDEQKRGACITYEWRYTYSPLMGLVDNSYDDDGESVKIETARR